jgi:hypothetical protein
VPQKLKFSVSLATLGVGLGLAATAFAAVDEGGLAGARPSDEITELQVIERGAERFDRAVTDHRVEQLSDRYSDLYWKAEDLDAAPARSVAGADDPSVADLEQGLDGLRDRVEKAREAAKAAEAAPEASGDYGLVGGVSQATLDAIAACESGGDPTAVNGAGYYGKYQFDLGTWQSVGGTGNPADAPESEQDMRASMLYAQAGTSPWPVCGQ